MARGRLCWHRVLAWILTVILSEDKVNSLNLSCSVGPVHVVLQPNQTVVLDCNLPAVDQPANITWKKGGIPVVDQEPHHIFPNGSLYISDVPRDSTNQDGGSSEGSYTCMSQNSFGATTSRTALIRFSTLSRFHQQPESQVVEENGIARFECGINGLPLPVVTWEKNQSAIPNHVRFIVLPNGILQIVNVQVDDAGVYRCIATNSVRKGYSQDATLTVLQGFKSIPGDVVIIAHPKNVTVISGQTAIMECLAYADPTPFVSWIRQDGKPIATDAIVVGRANLMIAHTQLYHSGVYVCRANKPRTRQFVTAAAELRVLAPPMITQFPETISRIRASTARFACKADGEPPPRIRWLKNGEDIMSNGRVKIQNSGSLVINQIGLEDAAYYQCIAENRLGMACTTAKLAVTVREGLPSAPKRVSATPLTSTAVLVSWERPEHNSEQIIGFSLHYQKAVGTNNVEYQFAVNNDTTELQVKDLQPNTNYTFYVVAYSQLGASRTSHSMIVQTMEDVPSTAPQLSLSIPTLTDIRVTWLPLSPELSHGKITKYRIDYCTLKEDRIYSIEVDGNETQVTLPTVQSKKIYKVRIAASTSVGYGAPSEWTQHLIPERNKLIMVPFAPTEMKVKTKVDSLLVTWQPPSNQVQIQGYKLYYREAGVDDSSKELRESNNEEHWTKGPIRLRRKVKQYEITGLVSDKLYEIKLIAFNKQDDGYAAVWKGKTEKAPALTIDLPVMLPPPTQLRAESNSSRAIWLHWTRPPFTTVQIENYTIRCSPSGLKNASLVTYFTSSEEEIFITSLKPYTRYEFAVQSHGIGVDGPFSGIVEGLTLSDRHIFSTDVQGLESNTRYFFKMGAKTVVGTGPYSTTKDVQTLPKRILGLHDLLDIHSVTGIIVGVCLGLLCILFCICASFCNNKRREGSSCPNSHLTTEHAHYRRARKASSTHSIPHPHAQELETLMTTPAEDLSLSTKLTELTEVHIFMDNRLPDDGIQLKLKSAWNGSIHHKWANDAIFYSSAILPDSACKTNEPLRLNPDTSEDDLRGNFVFDSILGTARKEHPPSGLNCVEAEVIVHSELSASERNSTCEDQDWQSKEDLQVRSISASSTEDLHSEYIPMLFTESWKRKQNLEIECTAVVPAEDWNEDAQNKCVLALPAKENQPLEICKNSLSAVANEVMNCIETEKHRDVTEPQDNSLLHSKTRSSKMKTAESHGLTNGFQSIEGWKSSVNGFTLKNRNSESSCLKNTETLPARCQPLLTGEDVAANHFIASSITTTSASEKDLCP
ncbi:immunoglobulin superfamily DCC subclass member 4 isoform X2 [Scyliorhinus canicula]|uniref:immunoglobulin superfamily DCC subclass member 4 isoform X2 n=1 Tax=Scyliorhinus canicula TaxID=7830 RepID=UPI0018F58F6C|nr:immunoglobulin superfamily DCC subclass member 4 isoform X2 [Scyliorhinus canicula]